MRYFRPGWALSAPVALLLVMSFGQPALAGAAGAYSSRAVATSASTRSRPPRAAEARTLPRPLSAAARRAARADRALVSAARALHRCLNRNSARPKRCSATRHAVQRAGSNLASAERALAQIARTTGAAATSRNRSQRAPLLTVSGQTLRWTRVANINTYVLATNVPGKAQQDSVITGTSTTPPPVPGLTVRYSVRTTVNGSAWSTSQSITYAAPEKAKPPEEVKPPKEVNTRAAPVLSVSGQTLTWNALAGVSTYVLMSKVAGQTAQYSAVSGTSFTPTAVPGATVAYSIRTAVEGSVWSPEVSISYPAPTPPPPPPPPVTSKVIIGTNDALGWGDEVAQKILATGLSSARVEAGAGLNTPQHAREEGFTNNVVIVGNTSDEAGLSTVNTASWTEKALKEVREAVANGDTLLEVGNEMYLKGRSPHGATNSTEPAKYAEMYMSLAKAVDAAEIKGVKLLFNSFGDYARSNGTWSQVANGGGWIGDALAAQPGLKERLDGFTAHPYGLAGQNSENDWGPGALEAEHNQAATLGFVNTEYYVSEFGVQLETSGPAGSESPAQQAERVKAVYTELIGLGYVKGIWFYESHDESSTAKWGFVSGAWTPRPVLAVLEGFAKQEHS